MTPPAAPVVGIVIATVGRRSLEAALESIRDQSYGRWVGVVVFDGFEPRPVPGFRAIHLLDGPHRDWGAVATNVALSYLTGQAELIAYLDDDCTWHSDHLEKMVPLALQHGWAYRGSRIVFKDGGAENHLVPFDRMTYERENFIDSNEIVHRHHTAIRWSGEIYQNDWLLGLQLLEIFGEPAFCPEILGSYLERWDESRDIDI